MFYKLPKGTKAFIKLKAVEEKIVEANRAARKLAAELKAKHVVRSADTVAGGIIGFSFSKRPDRWKAVLRRHYENVYFPGASPENKDLLDRIKRLPKVTRGDVATASNYSPQLVGGEGNMRFSLCPAVIWGKEFILLEVASGADYKPFAGAVEITETEYRKLSKSLANKKKKS
jgi:hypothetical protein